MWHGPFEGLTPTPTASLQLPGGPQKMLQTFVPVFHSISAWAAMLSMIFVILIILLMVKSLPFNQVSRICQMRLCSKQEPCWASFLLRSRCLGGCAYLYFFVYGVGGESDWRWAMAVSVRSSAVWRSWWCSSLSQRPTRMANKCSHMLLHPYTLHIPWQLGTSWSSWFLDFWFSQGFIVFKNVVFFKWC